MTIRPVHRVAVLRRVDGATRDMFNNPEVGWVDGWSGGGWLQPRNRNDTDEEQVDSADVQVEDRVLYLPRAAEVSGRDRVVVNGDTFEVVGPPDPHVTLRGAGTVVDHWRVRVRRAT